MMFWHVTNNALPREHSDGATNEAVMNETGDVAENAVTDTDSDSKKYQTAYDVAEPETVETTSKTVPTRRGRSKKQKKLQSPPTAAPTRQTRRSRRSEPIDTDTTEESDSTVVEEEAVPVTGKTRRSHMTKSTTEEVGKLDIRDDDQEVIKGGVETSDIELEESSDVLSQSSVVPETESDSVREVPSESLPSSSETEAVVHVARPQRGRQTQGRKRKQGTAVAESSVRNPDEWQQKRSNWVKTRRLKLRICWWRSQLLLPKRKTRRWLLEAQQWEAPKELSRWRLRVVLWM